MPRTGYFIAVAVAVAVAVAGAFLLPLGAEADHEAGHPVADDPYWTCSASVARVTLLDADPIPPLDPVGANLEREECAEDTGGLPDIALPPDAEEPAVDTTTSQARTQIFCRTEDGPLLNPDLLPEDNPATPVDETEVCDAGVPAHRQHVLSTADVTDTTVRLGGLTIRVAAANTSAQARCGPGNVPVISSDSNVLGLSVGSGPGGEVPVPLGQLISGDPNQVIDIGIIRITLNELIVEPGTGEPGAPQQTVDPQTGVVTNTYPDQLAPTQNDPDPTEFGQVTRRAVHIEVPGGDEPGRGGIGDVVIAESIADFHGDVCPEGRIIVKKETAPDEPDPETTQFDFTAAPTQQGGPAVTPVTFDLTDDESQQLEGTSPTISDDEVLPGDYTVTELDPRAKQYRLTAVTCAENRTENSETALTPATGSGNATITVEPGETVTCTFINSKEPPCPPPAGVPLPGQCRGKIVIKKETVPDEPAVANQPTFPFTISGGLTPSPFALADDGSQEFINVVPNGVQGAPESYTVSETLPADSSYRLSAILCAENRAEDSAANVAQGNLSGSATIKVNFEETVTCTFINTKQPAGLVCPDGSAPNAQNQCAIACPTGTTLQNGQCVGSINCPTGTTLQNGQCVGSINCPTGTTLQNGQCVGSAACPTGSTPTSAGQCVVNTTECPLGSSRNPQGQCVVGSVQCPAGTTFDPGSRSCLDAPRGGTLVPITDQIRNLFRGSPCIGGGFGPLIAILGTNGPDRITGTNRSDRIFALGGNDRVSGGRGDDCVEGGSGNDVLDGSNGNDFLLGGTGNDQVNGGPGRDRFTGGSGRDGMSGGSGNDRMNGGSGRDRLNGGYGNDRLIGGSGNDGIHTGNGRDVVNAGSGNDVVNAATRGPAARVNCGTGRKDRVRINRNETRRIRGCEFVDVPRRIRSNNRPQRAQ